MINKQKISVRDIVVSGGMSGTLYTPKSRLYVKRNIDYVMWLHYFGYSACGTLKLPATSLNSGPTTSHLLSSADAFTVYRNPPDCVATV